MKILRALVAASFVSMLPVAIPASGASNQGDDTSDPSAIAEDAEYLVRTYGFTASEAAEYIAQQDDVGMLEGTLRKSAPDFAGLFIQYEPSYKVVALTTGSTEQMRHAVENDAAATLLGETDVRNVDYSEAELVAVQEAVGESAPEASFGSDIDVTRNLVTITAATDKDAELVRVAMDRMGVPEGMLELAVASSEFVLSDTICTWGDGDVCGGEALVKLNSDPECTAGFTVNDGDGHEGTTTAAHCANMVKHEGVELNFQSGQNSGSRDIQWHLSPGLPDLPKVRDGNSPPRTITSKLSRDNQTVDTVVCMFGNVSGYHCGQLKSKNYDPPNACTSTTDPNPTYMRVDDPDVEFGDSGGPVYESQTALGFEKGYACDFGSGTSQYYYMAQNYVGDLGVSVSLG